MITAEKIISYLSSLAPEKYALEWDNSGLQLGEVEQEINKVLTCLDITENIIKEAVKKDCNMIVSHHPFIFESLDQISTKDKKGQQIIKVLKNKLVIYSAHTNLDLAPGGLNDYLAQKLNLNQISPFIKMKEEDYYKLVVFIPISHFEEVRKQILNQGAGYVGNYSHTSFSVKGQGSFKPLDGSQPYQGQKNKFSEVQEYRLETIVAESDLGQVKEKLLDTHPYEEVAFDIYPLVNNKQTISLGRRGELSETVPAKEFLNFLKKKLSPPNLKYTGDPETKIKTVAVCSGSGGDYITQAVVQGADLFVTGDVKYHQALEAKEKGLFLVDAGHYGTEIIARKMLAEKLSRKFDKLKIVPCQSNTYPWNIE